MTTPCTVTGISFADAFLEALARFTRPQSRMFVLDVGIGTGRIPIEICTRQSGIEIFGVDHRPAILQRARRNIHHTGFADVVRVHRADASSLPYADATFDAVISNSLLHHLAQPLDALREMVRVARPGGLLLVRDSLRQPDTATIAGILCRSDDNRDGGRRSLFQYGFHAALTLDQTRDLVSTAGLPAEWVEPAGPSHWVVCGRLGG
jgi:ubiquinone/menaquinone biosynthesis C-methylase UbiE